MTGMDVLIQIRSCRLDPLTDSRPSVRYSRMVPLGRSGSSSKTIPGVLTH